MKRKICALLALLMIAVMLTGCGLEVPRPEIKEGRFNFSITYEMNGEIMTYSDTYVCKFDGTSWTLDGGYSRDWNDYTEKEHEGDAYCAILGKTDDGGDIVLFFGIYPEYFMGDSTGDRGEPEPSIYINYPEDENGHSSSVAEPDRVEEIYGIKIISYEYDEPVENNFRMLDFF